MATILINKLYTENRHGDLSDAVARFVATDKGGHLVGTLEVRGKLGEPLMGMRCASSHALLCIGAPAGVGAYVCEGVTLEYTWVK